MVVVLVKMVILVVVMMMTDDNSGGEINDGDNGKMLRQMIVMAVK